MDEILKELENAVGPVPGSQALLAAWSEQDPETRELYERDPDCMHSMLFEAERFVDIYRRWKLSTPHPSGFLTSLEEVQLQCAWMTFINLFAESWGYGLEDLFDMEKKIYLMDTPRAPWNGRNE